MISLGWILFGCIFGLDFKTVCLLDATKQSCNVGFVGMYFWFFQFGFWTDFDVYLMLQIALWYCLFLCIAFMKFSLKFPYQDIACYIWIIWVLHCQHKNKVNTETFCKMQYTPKKELQYWRVLFCSIGLGCCRSRSVGALHSLDFWVVTRSVIKMLMCFKKKNVSNEMRGCWKKLLLSLQHHNFSRIHCYTWCQYN